MTIILQHMTATIGRSTFLGCHSAVSMAIANSATSITNASARYMAYVSNKRITRIPAETGVQKSDLNSKGNEAYIDVRLTNKNPRNLEQMLFAQKPMGFELDSPNRHYWNKVVFEKKSNHLVGKIVHHSGRTVGSATSSELPIAAKVSSPLSLKAAKLLGQVLAVRSLESGIHSVFCDYDLTEEASSKLTALKHEFIKTFSSNGISFEEQKFIFNRSKSDL